MYSFVRTPRNGTLRDRGFSITELLATMIIMGLLAAIALPMYTNQRAVASRAAAESDARAVLTELTEMFGAVTAWGADPYMVGNVVNDRLTVTFYNTGGTPTTDTFDVLLSNDSTYHDGSTPDADNPYSYCVVIENKGQYGKASENGFETTKDGSALSCP